MRKRIKLTLSIGMLTIACIMLSACPTADVKNAANAVNKYADTLSAFQDAEQQLFDAHKIADVTHHEILRAEITAAKTGHDLDAAIAIAAKGGDPSQYVDLANNAFDQVLATIQVDPATENLLQLTAQTANAALKNAISLINALKANAKPSPVTPAPTPAPSGALHHNSLWVLAFAIFPMMAVAGGAASVLSLLQIIVTLEPVAFDLILKFATSLKGKTAEEILALNESMFDKVEQQAQAELNKLSSS